MRPYASKNSAIFSLGVERALTASGYEYFLLVGNTRVETNSEGLGYFTEEPNPAKVLPDLLERAIQSNAGRP